MAAGDLSGQILDGRYQVLEQLGEGAMGCVYRGERLKLGRIVAIKVMNERLPDAMSSGKRFEREATAMAKLEHPHCASVLDIGVHNSRPYVVMDFVSGTPLNKLIEQGPVPSARAVEITRQVLSGLSHAHELGIVHRDIKPANIVLSHKSGLGDHVKILDFGLARLNEESSNLTSGVILGTPSYMAPEQIRGILIDGRTDVYACGVMLFELLTGIKPYRSANNEPIEVCMMHINVPVPRLADSLPGHDFGALEAIVARALEKDRDRRYATAGEFANALSELGARPNYQTPPSGVMIQPVVAPPAEPTTRVKEVSPFASAATSAISVDASAQRPKEVSAFASAAASAIHVDASAHRPKQVSEFASAATSAIIGDAPAPPATVPGPPRPASRRGLIIGGVAAVVVVIIVVVVAGMRGGKPTPVASPPPPVVDAGVVVAEDKPGEEDPVAELVTRAGELASGGRLKPAVDLLVKARRAHPQDARLPFHAGMLYVNKMFFADGLPLIRAAFALDPAYRSDPALIKALLRGFNATASYDGAIARFMRDDVGEAAKPYLAETASSHPNPIVRKRAAAELARY
ncbi:MAG: serine/threonine protein kinase [Deltaproteobacteria bacterium]|nr:serine/threonine protein kinase [Deltaproteobacteria bacterium]